MSAVQDDQDPKPPAVTTTTATQLDPEQVEGTTLGGFSSPAFCLLDGFSIDPKSSEQQRVTIPIARLPAILGRSHDTSDIHFFGMGKAKALSRKQCKIEFRVVSGTLGQTVSAQSEEFAYTVNKLDKDDFVYPERLEESESKGFFTITNLGKNAFYVNGDKVQQGETAVLKDEDSISLASYSMYFFMPLQPFEKMMTIGKKRKRATAAESSKQEEPIKPSSAVMAPGGKATKAVVSELERLPTEELLKLMTRAVEKDSWERKDQFVGATLSFRAVTEAAKDPKFQEEKDGVARGDLMDWIAESPKFKVWNEQMRSKLEFKSFQSSITKAMVRAGYERTSSTGRYIKWVLPPEFRKHEAIMKAEFPPKVDVPGSALPVEKPTAAGLGTTNSLAPPPSTDDTGHGEDKEENNSTQEEPQTQQNTHASTSA